MKKGEGHYCPRRRESHLSSQFPGPDTWTSRAGLVGQPSGCSYCGSMNPDDFMEAVRSGLEIEPTDKSYKLYVNGIPNPQEGGLRVIGVANHSGSGWTAYKDLGRREKRVVKQEYGDEKDFRARYYQLTPWGPTTEGKFYTAHLSPEQGFEFRELWLSGKVNWGYPGHPYRPLYIPGPSEAAAEE